MPSLEDFQRGYHNAMQAGDTEAAQSFLQDITAHEKAASQARAASEMEPMQRALVNAGAGVQNLIDSGKQLFGGGPSDAEIRDKRARDEQLAQATDLHLLPDWMPTGGKVMQMLGETAPTLAAGAGLGRLAVSGAQAVPALARTAQALANRIPAGVRSLATTAPVAGAAGGAASGALQPVTSDESRAGNMALGAATGAVLPGAIGAVKAGVNKAWDYLSPVRGAATYLKNALGAQADAVANSAEQRLLERQATQHPAVQAVPESLSEATGSAAASRLESQARRDPGTADAWTRFVEGQNQARFGAVADATKDAGRLDARVAARTAATEVPRDVALAQANLEPDKLLKPVWNATDVALAGESGSNPEVQRVADYVRRQLFDKTFPLTPERLYSVRKTLADKLDGKIALNDELGAAAKQARRETMQIIDGIDDSLNYASGGRWSPYMDKYSQMSRGVDASKAAIEAQVPFGKESLPELGGVPHVRLTELGQAQKAGMSSFDPTQSALSPESQRIFGDLTQQLKFANSPAYARKFSGTQGGGSQTSTDLTQDLSRGALKLLALKVPGLSHVIEWGSRAQPLAVRTEISRLLQDPSAAAAAIRAAQARGLPLSQGQTAIINALMGAMSAGAQQE